MRMIRYNMQKRLLLHTVDSVSFRPHCVLCYAGRHMVVAAESANPCTHIQRQVAVVASTWLVQGLHLAS